MFAVFTDIISTEKGKSLARKHNNTGNAQLIFQELVAHATDLTKASVKSSDLLSYITSTKLGDGT